MSTTRPPRRGLSKRLWHGLKTITRQSSARSSLNQSVSYAHTLSLRNRLLTKAAGYRLNPPHGESSPMPTMQPDADISTVDMPSADTVKVNPAEWLPVYQDCMKHFLNVAQHRPKAKSLAAFINIRLPCERDKTPIRGYSATMSDYSVSRQYGPVSLTPYIRRLVVTGTDTPAIMEELFGEDWVAGVGPLHAQERENYLFTAKSGGWLKTKAHYDISPYETVPFLCPLRDPQEEELRAAEARWSRWLLMEDWMVGPRSPFEETTEAE